jgi:hypothetical protein
MTCKCKSLSPTTVLNDLKDLLGNSKLGDVFSSKGLTSFLEMKYWEYPIFYILAFKTIIFIYFLVKGYKQDKEDILMRSQVSPEEIKKVKLL